MTLLSVGDITKLYFVIFGAFKESMTLNLAQKSFEVILPFWYESKARIHIPISGQ